jgi:hypothetical protein
VIVSNFVSELTKAAPQWYSENVKEEIGIVGEKDLGIGRWKEEHAATLLQNMQ